MYGPTSSPLSFRLSLLSLDLLRKARKRCSAVRAAAVTLRRLSRTRCTRRPPSVSGVRRLGRGEAAPSSSQKLLLVCACGFFIGKLSRTDADEQIDERHVEHRLLAELNELQAI